MTDDGKSGDDAERVRAPETLQADAQSYAENIIETLREPFLVLDQELRVETANRAFYQTFLVAPAETIGQYIYDLGNRQWSIPKLRTLLEELLPQDHAFNDFTVEHDFPGLGRKIMLLNARRIRGPGSHSELILLAIEDITVRWHAERAVRESEERFHRLLDNLPVAAYMTDAAGLITYFNRYAVELWGREPALNDPSDRFCGSLKLYSADGAPLPHDACWMALTLRDGREYNGAEEGVERPDGVRRVILAHTSPFYDSERQLSGAANVVVDITDRRHAELILQTSEVRYRRLFETAKDGILILDAHTLEIIDANPFMSDLLGYPLDEFAGKELWQLGFFEDKQASQAAFRELQAKGYVRFDHLPLQTKLGRQIEVEFVSNVYRVENRLVAQCNIRDISERSRLERKTAEQAEALADLDRRKDEFLAMLSHELRNPLAPILNAVQLLRMQTIEDPIQFQARTIIERQVGQLTHLVDDLLEVSRITTGRIHLNQERLVLNGIVEYAVETVRPLIEQRRHTLELSLTSEPLWLFGDAARLEQVVVNLLTNAAKYTEDHGHIWVSTEQEGDEVVLRVRDSGVGILPELLPRIFELFTQGERSLDRSQGGLGIGLSLVQRLVEMHRGRVHAVSALGEGSEFIVRLPSMPTPSAYVAPSALIAKPATTTCRVLVVDDNADAAESLALLLQASRHDVRKAADGPAALAVALEFLPDVVLLDLGLPGLDGYEVANRIRQQPVFKNVVLVALTGYGQESDRQRSWDAGFDHHLVKPAEFAKLQKILAAVATARIARESATR